MWSRARIGGWFSCVVAVAVMFGFVAAAWAQLPQSDCSDLIDTGRGVNGPNLSVKLIMPWDPDGAGPSPEALAVWGDFYNAGTTVAPRHALWDGENWRDLMAPSQSSWQVVSMIVYQGQLIRLSINSSAVIERWTGESWVPLPGGLSGLPYAAAVYDGAIVVVGLLHIPGSTQSVSVARFDGAGWSRMGVGLDNQTMLSVVVHNEQLFIGGYSLRIGQSNPTGILRWSGNAWEPVPGAPVSGATSLVSHGGMLYARFGSTASSSSIQRWDGAAWTNWGATLGIGDFSSVLPADIGGTLYLHGRMQLPGVSGYVTVARWNGSGLEPDDPEPVRHPAESGLDFSVKTLALFRGRLIAGRSISFANPSQLGFRPTYLYTRDESGWSPILNGTDGALLCSSNAHDGLLVGGRFRVIEGVRADRVARLTDGHWQPVGSGLNLDVRAVGAHNGDVYIAPMATTVPLSADERRIQKWDGQHWVALGEVTARTSDFTCTAIASYGGALIAAGSQTTTSAEPLATVMYWDGSAWQVLGGGVAGYVSSLCVYNDELYAGGGLTNAGGVPTNNVARWDGVAWRPVGAGLNGPVADLKIHGNQLAAAGRFTGDGGAAPSGIGLWNGNGWQLMTLPGALRGVRIASSGEALSVAAGDLASQILTLRDGTWTRMNAHFTSGTPFVWALAYDGSVLLAGGGFERAIADSPTAPSSVDLASYVVRMRAGSPPPRIDGQVQEPAGIICRATTLTLSADVHNAQRIEWLFNHTALSDGVRPSGAMVTGSRAATMTITGPGLTEGGVYTCRVWGYCNAIESNDVEVVVRRCGCGLADVAPAGELSGGDGVLDASDIILYLQEYFRNQPLTADLCAVGGRDTPDRLITPDDLVRFLRAFFEGCGM